MNFDIDCLLIGNNDTDFNEYVKQVRKMGDDSGAHHDLRSNYIYIDNKAYNAKQVYNYYDEKKVDLSEVFSATNAYLGTYLHKHGLTFDYINAYQDDKSKLKKLLLNKKIGLVAITTTLYVSVFPIMEIMKFIKEYNPDVKVIVGGPFVTTQAKTLDKDSLMYLLKMIGADFFINSSQGEWALVSVLKAMKKNTSYDEIHNLFYKRDEDYIFTEIMEEDNRLSENMVKWELFTDIGQYLNLRTSISCPFSCSFCAFPEHAGKYQIVSVEDIEKELDAIEAKKTVKSVFFVDDTLNVPGERFKELLRMMIRKKYSFNWYSHYRCQFTDEETAQLMKESGCEGVFLGIESGSDKILSYMNKKATTEQYRKGISLLKKYGITMQASFIIGFPGETEDTIKETINFIKTTEIDYYRVQLWYCDTTTRIYREGRERFGITGSQFEWNHTMDTKTATQYMNDITLQITDKIRIPNYFDIDAVIRLKHNGVDKQSIDEFLKIFHECVQDKLLYGDENITAERERQFRAFFYRDVMNGMKENSELTDVLDFDF